jgi:hypothetical protein
VVLAAAVAVFGALREPYPQRQLKEGLRAFEQGQYSEAIDHLSLSLAEAESPQTYLARGRAYFRVGKMYAAADDLILADKLQPTGQTQAALGYCYSLMGNHRWAIGCYRLAMARDFKTAVVFNNLAYSLMMTGEDDKAAAEYLRMATQADPRLQAAYYNLATLELKKAVNDRDRISSEGLVAIAKAIELGPTTARLHLDAAYLCVLASKIEPRWKELALEHLEAAIDRGLPPTDLKKDPVLRLLAGDRFKRLTERPAVNASPTHNPRVLDPLEKR